MDFQKKNYQLIQNSIEYMVQNYESQPNLDAMASMVGLSPSHFQKMFLAFVGVSPKQFLSSITVTHAKRLIKNSSLLDVTHQVGLSGSGRLHDLFIKLEAMTPGIFKSAGVGLTLYYEFFPTILGDMVVVSSDIGIQNLQFLEGDGSQNKKEILEQMQTSFSKAVWKEENRSFHNPVKHYLQTLAFPNDPIHLSVLGTPFQLKVWQSLLSIPSGGVSTYGAIAESIGQTNAQRAVGTAIGKNPIAVLIPCHRVIQSSGLFGGYRWNPKRKRTLIAWENAIHSPKDLNQS